VGLGLGGGVGGGGGGRVGLGVGGGRVGGGGGGRVGGGGGGGFVGFGGRDLCTYGKKRSQKFESSWNMSCFSSVMAFGFSKLSFDPSPPSAMAVTNRTARMATENFIICRFRDRGAYHLSVLC